MEGLTKTTFGLVIAYLLPGFAALYGLSWWSDEVTSFLTESKAAETSAGIVTFTLMACLTIGLLLNAFCWIFIQRIICGFCLDIKPIGSAPMDLPLHGSTLDENFRYCQFYGSMVFANGIIFGGWLYSADCFCPIIATFGFFTLEIVCILSAVEAFRRYTTNYNNLNKEKLIAQRPPQEGNQE
jgi:hypothetical protein